MLGEKHQQAAPFNVPTVCEVTSDAVNDAFQSLARQLNDIVAPPIQKNFDPETGKLLKIKCGTTGPTTVSCINPTDWSSEVGNELLAASAYAAMGVSGDGLWLWGIKNVSPGSNGKIYTWALSSTTGFPISTTPTSSAASTTLRSVTDCQVTDQTGTKLMCVKGSTLQFVSMASGVPTVRGSVASPAGSPAAYAEGIWIGNRVVFCPKINNQVLWVIDASDLDNPVVEHQVTNAESGGMTQGKKVYCNEAEDILIVAGTDGIESFDWASKGSIPTSNTFVSIGWSPDTFSYDEEKEYCFVVQWTNNTTLTYKTIDIAADGATLSINTSSTITGTFTNYQTFREAWAGYDLNNNVTTMLNLASTGAWLLVFDMDDLTAVTIHENFAATGAVNTTYAKWLSAGNFIWLWGTLGVATEVFEPATTNFIIPCQLEIGRIKFTLTDPPCTDTRVITGIPAGHGTITDLDADRLDGQDGPYYLDSDNFTGTEWIDLTDAGETALHTHDHGSLNGLADDDHAAYPLVTNFEVDRATLAARWVDLTDAGATTLHKHDHGGQDGLSDDDHTQYALLAGRATGQALNGGTASQDDLELNSTAHATKGDVLLEGGLVKVSRNGNYVRIQDPGLTDYAQFQHDGTNFQTTFSNTSNWVIGGTVDMNNNEIHSTPGNRGMIDGLTMVNSTTDSAHDIAIETGAFESSIPGGSRDFLYDFPTRLIKRIDAAWAVGTNQGGMATGSVANNTEYNVIVIANNTTSAMDVMFDVSATGANVPSGWTAQRRIGSVFTDGSANIHAFRQQGDRFEYLDPIYTVADTTGTLGTWQTTITMKLPASMMGHFYGQATVNNCTQPFLHIRHGDSAAAASIANAVAMDAEAASGFRAVGGFFDQMVDANSQVDYTIRGSGATPATDWVQMDIVLRGWTDNRGKDE